MKTARTILEAALAALDETEAQTTAQRMAEGSPRDSHNNPTTAEQRDRNHQGGTTLARRIAARESYLEKEGLK